MSRGNLSLFSSGILVMVLAVGCRSEGTLFVLGAALWVVVLLRGHCAQQRDLYGRAAMSTVRLLFTFVVLAMAGCSGSHGTLSSPAGPIGQECTSVSECYVGLDAAALQDQVTCLTQLQNGYCTHTCTSDADCCGVPGECPKGFKETCSPFESTGQTYCFLACDSASLAADPGVGTTSASTFCQDWANPTFTCRSTGGGSSNQQFCGP